MGNGLLRWTFFSIAVTAVVACGGGGSKDEYFRRQQQDAEALKARYDAVKGIYEGTISNSAAGLREQKAKFWLYYVNVPGAANPDGSLSVYPRLKARFRTSNILTATDSLILSGESDDFGNLRLSSAGGEGEKVGPGGKGEGGNLMLSIEGTATQGQLAATVTRENGVWGRFAGVRVSTEASAPGEGEMAEDRARVLRLLREVAGEYQGKVTPADTGKFPFAAAIHLTLVEQPGGAPALIGTYKLECSSVDCDYPMNVDYYPLTNEVSMRTTEKSAVPFSMSGRVQGGRLTVTIQDLKRGFLVGEFTGTRR